MLKTISWVVAVLFFITKTNQTVALTSCLTKADFNSKHHLPLREGDFEATISLDRRYISSHPGPFYLIDWDEDTENNSEAIVVVNIFDGEKFVSPNGVMTADELNERIVFFKSLFDGHQTQFIDCLEVEHALFKPALNEFPNNLSQNPDTNVGDFRVVYLLFKRPKNQFKVSNEPNSVISTFKKLPESKRYRRYLKLYRTLAFLHNSGVVHGHLALDSLSLDDDSKDLVINDIRNYIKNNRVGEKENKGQYTCNIYAPPEKFTSIPSGGLLERMDAYSFGMIIAAIEFGESSVEGTASKFCARSYHNYIWTVSQNLKMILESHPTLGFNSKPVRENTAAALISECTNVEASARPEDPKIACRLNRLRLRTKGYQDDEEMESDGSPGNLLDKGTDEEICEKNRLVSMWSKNQSFGIYFGITIVGLAILIPIIYFYVIRR